MQADRVDDSSVYFSWSPEWQAFHGQEDWNEDGTYHCTSSGLGKPEFRLLFRGTGVSLFGRTSENTLGDLHLAIIDTNSRITATGNVTISLSQPHFANSASQLFTIDDLPNSEYILYGTVVESKGPPGPILYMDYAEIRNSEGTGVIPQRARPSLSNMIMIADNDEMWIRYQSSWFFGGEVDGAPVNETWYGAKENWTANPGASVTVTVPSNSVWIVSSFGPNGADVEITIEGSIESDPSVTSMEEGSITLREAISRTSESSMVVTPTTTSSRLNQDGSSSSSTISSTTTRSSRFGSTLTTQLLEFDRIKYTMLVSSYSRIPLHKAVLWSAENHTLTEMTLTIKHAGREGQRLSINYLLFEGTPAYIYQSGNTAPELSMIASISAGVTVILANLIILLLMRRYWDKKNTTRNNVETTKVTDYHDLDPVK